MRTSCERVESEWMRWKRKSSINFDVFLFASGFRHSSLSLVLMNIVWKEGERKMRGFRMRLCEERLLFGVSREKLLGSRLKGEVQERLSQNGCV